MELVVDSDEGRSMLAQVRDVIASPDSKWGHVYLEKFSKPGTVVLRIPQKEAQQALKNGDSLLSQCKYHEAIEVFKHGLAAILGRKFVDECMPITARRGNTAAMAKHKFPAYEIPEEYNQQVVSLICLCIKIGLSLVKLDLDVEASFWLREAIFIRDNMKYALPAMFEWIFWHPQNQTYFDLLMSAHSELSRIYLGLSNTSLAHHYADDGLRCITSPGPDVDTNQTKRFMTYDIWEIQKLRHPDPQVVERAEVSEESLQLRGSWERLVLPKCRMQQRLEFTSFLHKGYLYVLGGRTKEYIQLRDFWRVDLQKLDRWEELSPIPSTVLPDYICLSAGVYDSRAWVFTGVKDVSVFDLKSKKWSAARTTGKCFYPNIVATSRMCDFGTVIARAKLYVFGGTHTQSPVGCSLLQVLDLKTLEWSHLSGDWVSETPNWDHPGPRRYPTLWTDKNEETIFLMYGEANRDLAQMAKHKFGADVCKEYEDFWSYDISTNEWTKELITGNFPCIRSEMAACFNPVLNHTVFFGGYSPTLRTGDIFNGGGFGYTYFADTFILPDSTPTTPHPHFKHVLTRGFPGYRAQGRLHCDTETGNMYLYGGYINSAFVERKSRVHFHADLWRLRLDVEGGGFDDVAWKDECRTAPAGPWRRCFSCGKTGQWKKCGGSCNGKAYFCDTQCLKDGWKEHKEIHTCRKI